MTYSEKYNYRDFHTHMSRMINTNRSRVSFSDEFSTSVLYSQNLRACLFMLCRVLLTHAAVGPHVASNQSSVDQNFNDANTRRASAFQTK